jgi:hypothetical protein
LTGELFSAAESLKKEPHRDPERFIQLCWQVRWHESSTNHQEYKISLATAREISTSLWQTAAYSMARMSSLADLERAKAILENLQSITSALTSTRPEYLPPLGQGQDYEQYRSPVPLELHEQLLGIVGYLIQIANRSFGAYETEDFAETPRLTSSNDDGKPARMSLPAITDESAVHGSGWSEPVNGKEQE